jgi:hypothetical protein
MGKRFNISLCDLDITAGDTSEVTINSMSACTILEGKIRDFLFPLITVYYSSKFGFFKLLAGMVPVPATPTLDSISQPCLPGACVE